MPSPSIDRQAKKGPVGSGPEPESTVAVAVSFDVRLDSLLETGRAVAQRIGAKLRLVHVCDPWIKSYLMPEVESGPPELVQALREEVLRTADRRLKALRRSMDEQASIETVVLDGDLVRNLSADAEENGVGLIVIGADRGGIGGTSLGFSTAVGLISEGGTPCLVVNEAARPLPEKEPWTILVADDFTDVSQAALRLGFALALRMPRTTLVHLHVESHAESGRHRRLPRSSAPPELTPERLRDALAKAEERMLERSAQHSAALAAMGSTYVLEVVTGNVVEEIARTVAANRVSLAIFGQHRLFHRDGAQEGHAGQVPFKTMLTQSCPVIVVPQHT